MLGTPRTQCAAWTEGRYVVGVLGLNCRRDVALSEANSAEVVAAAAEAPVVVAAAVVDPAAARKSVTIVERLDITPEIVAANAKGPVLPDAAVRAATAEVALAHDPVSIARVAAATPAVDLNETPSEALAPNLLWPSGSAAVAVYHQLITAVVAMIVAVSASHRAARCRVVGLTVVP